MDVISKWAQVVGRVALGTIFVASALGKLAAWHGTAAYAGSKGVSGVLLAIATVLELFGGISIVVGFKARWGALALLIFLVPVTLVFHNFWAIPAEQQQMEMVNFLKNLAIGERAPSASTAEQPRAENRSRARGQHNKTAGHERCSATQSMGRPAWLVTLSFVFAGAASSAAGGEPARTVTVMLGARSRAGWFHNLFLGAHWWEASTTPIEVPVLDLETFDGGLRPNRLGGGSETNSLHFKSANGRTWAFRSVDKDPTRAFDPDTRNSWLGELAQDQTSTAHPCGALMLPPLLDAAGILHATPQLAALPDDPCCARLGRFYFRYLGLGRRR